MPNIRKRRLKRGLKNLSGVSEKVESVSSWSKLPKWPDVPYAGEDRRPLSRAVDPTAGTWPLYFLRRDHRGKIKTLDGKWIKWDIRDPRHIDFYKELQVVQNTLRDLTHEQVRIAEYWSSGPPTKQWTPIIDRLIDTYGLSAPYAARVLAAVQAGMSDAFVMTWFFKYKWEVPRPNQLDRQLATIACTPYHPSYPSGHSTISGCAEVILSYYFPAEADRLRVLAEECANARLYAGVHYKVDDDEGLRLGRQIGHFVVAQLKKQKDALGQRIDHPYVENRYAELLPPPYVQAIPFPRGRECDSLLDPRQAPRAR